MGTVFIIILIVIATILMLVELFIIPGTSFAGILSFCCYAFTIYYAFSLFGAVGGFVTLSIVALVVIAAIIIFMKSKTLDKLALKKEITSEVDRDAEKSIKVGDKGVSTTRLAQIGYAEINGKIVEVKTNEGLLDEKTPIIVVRVSNRTIFVERRKH